MPRINKKNETSQKDFFTKNDIAYAPTNVKKTSMTAILKIRIEWIPFPGIPKEFLNSQKFIYNSKYYVSVLLIDAENYNKSIKIFY